MKVTEESRIAIIAPHPEDATFGAGGLLQAALAAGAEVRVIYATDGEKDSWLRRASERCLCLCRAKRAEWGERRREEALAALECLGVSRESADFLGYEDQTLTDLLLRGGEEKLHELAARINDWGPTLLVLPSLYDVHPDHSALAVLVHLACLRSGSLQSYLSVMSYILDSRSPETGFNKDASPVSLLPEQQERKVRALACHNTLSRLGKRRLTKLASRAEMFVPVRAPANEISHHPVTKASTTVATLRLELASRASLRAFGARTAYLVGEGEAGERVRFAMKLRRKSREINVYDLGDGKVFCKAGLCGRRRRLEIQAPLSKMPQVDKLFIKVQRRFGFFDEAGWREIPVRGRPAPAAMGDVADGQAPGKQFSVCCVIPCFDAAPHCGEVLRKAVSVVDQVIAINDGSKDETAEILREVTEENKGRVRVISFVNNRGKGAALLTGFRYAVEKLAFDVLVTLDGNGRYDPADITRLVEAFEDEDADFLIGDRFAAPGSIPFLSRVGNRISTAMLRGKYPCSPRDTQCSFRAVKRGFVREIASAIGGGRYETELYILMLALERGKRIVPVPVEARYRGLHSSSHYHPIGDGLSMYRAFRNFHSFISAGSAKEDVLRRQPE
jgi:LmbE family N-acetylglucosaminyl deacetylase